MPHKHENSRRWGGPGASHEDRSKPMPEKRETRPNGSPTNPPTSTVSGGGGERDLRHSHHDAYRSSKGSRDGEGEPVPPRGPRKH